MTYTYRLSGIDCANCASKIERGILKTGGVSGANLAFMTQKLVLTADHDPIGELEDIVKRVDKKITIAREDI